MDQVRQRTKQTLPSQTKELIEKLNPLLRGWGEYYKRAHVRKLFQRLDGRILRRICWKGIHVDLSSTDAGSQVVRAYLSRQHFENVENSCPMTALPSYVARSGKDVKRVFETAFKAMVSVLERSLLNKEGPSHVRALR